jgi:hypothetical protein
LTLRYRKPYWRRPNVRMHEAPSLRHSFREAKYTSRVRKRIQQHLLYEPNVIVALIYLIIGERIGLIQLPHIRRNFYRHNYSSEPK